MAIATYGRTPVSTVTPDETLRAAAQRMEKEGIGLLVVTEEERVRGVLTDRDVALHAIAGSRGGPSPRVADAMSEAPVSIEGDAALEDALARMLGARVRRLPVVEGGRLSGMLSADDVLRLLAGEIGGLGEVLAAQLPGEPSRAGAEAPRQGAGAGAPGRGRAHRAAEHYGGEVVTAVAETHATEVARRMQVRAVGSVVVLGEDGRAVGIVTDRDLALRVVAPGLDPAALPVSAIMSAPLLAAQPEDPLEEVVARMRSGGVRRIPVLRDGYAVGIVTFDDLLVTFGHELQQLADCVAGELRRTRLRSNLARVRDELEQRIEEASARLRDVGDQTLRSLGREVDDVVDRVTQAIRIGGPRARGSQLRVAELMHGPVRSCGPDDALSEPARIMWEADCGCVPVLEGDGDTRVVGMITDRDICMASFLHGRPLSEMRVRQAMSSRVYACDPGDSLADAEAVMRAAQVRRLPVVDGRGRLRGMLSLADIAEAAAGVAAPAGAVSAEEVGRTLEAVCRPRSAAPVG